MRNRFPFPYPKAQGSALIVILIILGLAVALLVSSLKSNPQIERDKITADALAKAKDALIGFALRGDVSLTPSRPAVFPCPDTHVPSDPVVPANDPMYGTSDASCSDGAIGRFPWRSLKTDELLDDSGAPIWYALSGNFRNNSTQVPIINSDSKGTLQVRAPNGTTLLTQQGSEAAAILFAPGMALTGQARGTAAEKNSASNYLDVVGAISNATGAVIVGNCSVLNQGAAAQVNCPTFIAGSKSATFNDRLLLVTPKDFIPIIERRVAKIAESQLTGYYATCGYYPRPALFSNTECLPGGNTSGCIPDASATQGRFPYYAKTDFASLTMPDWVGLPAWFLGNRWDRVIYYAVAPGYALNAASQTCPGNCLTVDADTSVRRLIIMPGNATDYGNPRPSITLTDYLGDAENTNANNVFVTPTAATVDQMFKHPRPSMAPDTSTFSPLIPNPVCTGVSPPSSPPIVGGTPITLDATTITAACSGVCGSSGIDTGETTLTLTGTPALTITATGGTIGRNQGGASTDAIGVYQGGGTGNTALQAGESLSFSLIGNTALKFGITFYEFSAGDQALLTFMNSGSLVGIYMATTATTTNINPGGAFDEVVVQAIGTATFWIQTVKFCDALTPC